MIYRQFYVKGLRYSASSIARPLRKDRRFQGHTYTIVCTLQHRRLISQVVNSCLAAIYLSVITMLHLKTSETKRVTQGIFKMLFSCGNRLLIVYQLIHQQIINLDSLLTSTSDGKGGLMCRTLVMNMEYPSIMVAFYTSLTSNNY